jgi:hypothetical protein
MFRQPSGFSPGMRIYPTAITEARVFSGKKYRDGKNAGHRKYRTTSAEEIYVPGVFQPQFKF